MKKVIELRASNAHRWMVCHGQPQAVADIQDTSSTAADRGTVAHALLELMLRLHIPTDEIDRYAGKALLKEIEGRRADHITVDEEMMEGVAHAIDYVRSYIARHPKADYEPECLLDASAFVGKESGGTSDVIITDLPRELVILDYKSGVGHVDHVDNEQLYIYGLGALDRYSEKVTPKTKIRMVIVQPNTRQDVGPVRETVATYDDLLIFAQKAAAAAKEAYRKNPRRVAGDHCSFCKAAGYCKTFADSTLQSAALEFADIDQHVGDVLQHMDNLTNEEIARVLTAARTLRQWLDNVETEAVRRALDNQAIDGFKVVASRTHRRWDDESKVVQLIQEVSPKIMADLAPATPLSPSLMEKRLQRKEGGNVKLLKYLQRHVTRNPSEPKIAPMDDSRQPFRKGSEFG